MYRKYNFREQMALKAATQHFTYSTVSATSSQDSQPADCDWTVCYMLALSCGGVVQKKISAIPNESDTLSAVCAFGSVLLSSEIRPHPQRPKKKSRVFFLTCVMLHGLCPVAAKALTSAMTVFSINLHHVFFLFKPSLLLLLYNHQVTTHTHVVHRIVYYKRLYINFSINILYVQMEGRQISIFLPIKLSWNTFFFFFFALLESEQAKYIKALAAVS